MNYTQTIDRIFEQIEEGKVGGAVMGCLRIARHLNDFMYTAYFLRELYPGMGEFDRVFLDDTQTLKPEAQEFMRRRSLVFWLEVHTVDIDLGEDEDGEKRNCVAININDFDAEIGLMENSIQDLKLPSGMGEYDTAAFYDQHLKHVSEARLRIKVLRMVKERVKTRCFNYVTRLEVQLKAQEKSQGFLENAQNYVNNYFKAHSEETYTKLQKAAELIESDDPENRSLLLTEIRRALKSAADHFYPPQEAPVMCSDGIERLLGGEQYMNRLYELIHRMVARSSSRDFLVAEYEVLAVFARKLNDVASKGVHSSVTHDEARQGFLGLYLFLYNISRRFEERIVR